MNTFIGETLIGKDFVKLCNKFKLKLYKFTIPSEIHYGLLYKDGLNIDPQPFNQYSCSKGGIYFCDNTQIERWITLFTNNNYVQNIREVEIPNDAIVFIEFQKYKVNKIILHPAKKIYKIYDLIKIAVMQKGILLQFVVEQSEELCEIAIRQNPFALKFVKEKTEKLFQIIDEDK
jgi:hypothetical protein